ncbi:MAG: GNAT family N-acetyltransferase, partial [Candidatus Thorarchaeota archaeon]
VQNTTGYLEEDTTLESIRDELEDARSNYKFILFEAYESNQLIGLLLLFTNTQKFGLIWEWHPFVLPNKNEEDISKELIKKSIEFSKDNGIIRIEACFGIEKDQDKQRYLKYFRLYKKLGFHHVIEEAEMELNLNEKVLKKVKFTRNFEIKSVKNVEKNELFQCSFEIMNKSRDNMFLDLTEEQKWEVIKNYFEPSKPIIQEASIILTESNKIIGLAIAKYSTFEKGSATIGPFGILPNFRKKGLGETLLLFCLKKLLENNFRIINLDVAIENKPAYNLYSKVGFRKKFSTNILAINCN